MSNNFPETSIIIRTFNEGRWLPEVFSALDKQHYNDFEVLVVDSGSVDRTKDIAAANGARIIHLLPEDFTFGYSLNLGIQEAKGSIIVILTAHAIPAHEFWLGRLIKPLREHGTAMVYGRQRGHDEFSKFSEKRDFERLFKSQVHLAHEDDPFTNNANSAIRRELWEKYSFDEGLPGLEDTGWAKYWVNRGMRVLYEPTATVIHIHTETWPQLRNRYHREGMAARWIGLRMLKSIPGELWREIKWCFNDLWQAIVQERLSQVVGEVLRFRYEKTIGTIGGIIDSRKLESPANRAAFFTQKNYLSLVVKNPHQLHLEQRSIQELKPGEVLIRVSHVGICGTDLEVIDGKLGYYQSGIAKYPIVPGHEFSGIIASLGHNVAEFGIGDRVVAECIQGCGNCDHCVDDEAIRCTQRREVGVIGHDGGYAEYLVTRARYVHKIPDKLSLAEAALTEPLAVVIKGLRRLGSLSPRDDSKQCAVIGAGTIGQLSARILALRGHFVTVFDNNKARLETFGKEISTSTSLENIENFEWIIEATGVQSVLSGILSQSSVGVRILLLGLPYEDHTFNFESIVAYDRSVIGAIGSSAADFEEALELMPQINTSSFLGKTFPLEEFEEAFQLARLKSFLKIMFDIDTHPQ